MQNAVPLPFFPLKTGTPRAARGSNRYEIYNLYLEVSKSLVGFSHTVRIFFLLERSTFTLACRNDLIRQLLSHATTVSFPAITDQPLHAQRDLSVRTNFRRDLEGCTT